MWHIVIGLVIYLAGVIAISSFILWVLKRGGKK